MTSTGPAAAVMSAARAAGSSSRGASTAWSSPSSRTALQLLGGPGGADHRAAERPAELQRGRADAGPDRVHEHGLARLDAGLRDHRVVRGDEDLGHAARGATRSSAFGDRRALGRGHRQQLGLGAATGDAEHARRRARAP